MGRGSDHRDRRRRFGEQPADPWGDFAPPPSFDRPPPRIQVPRVSSGPEAEARVKWFNAEKGFGFVELTDGSGEAFLHIRPVEAAGHTSLEPGTTLMVRVGQGQRGPQVTEVLSIDTSTAEPEAPRRGPRQQRSGPPPGPARPEAGTAFSQAPETPGTVKWYDSMKGFGFISVEGEGKDLFVHRSALERAGLRDLAEGQQVRITVVEGRKGREVGAIELG
jgi:CspA family cold shock protein